MITFDQVKHWITLNEPNIFCIIGYLGIYAPGLDKSGRGDYTCGHNALLAHAKTYKMYQEEFKNLQQGFTLLNLINIALQMP